MDATNPLLSHTTPGADLRLEEFRALRATIRERGTLRIRLVVAGLVAWAVLHLGVQIWLPLPVTSLVPLLVLAAAFEGVFALHVGVERIGRYLEAAYEDPASPGPLWEHTAHAFGRTMTDSAGRLDPLGASLFVLAALLNLVPVLIAAWSPPFVELGVYGGIHLAFIIRIEQGRRFAKRQRGQELDQFARLTKTG
jgi:hypothetical protein